MPKIEPTTQVTVGSLTEKLINIRLAVIILEHVMIGIGRESMGVFGPDFIIENAYRG